VKPSGDEPRNLPEVDRYSAFNENWVGSDPAPRKQVSSRPSSPRQFPLLAVTLVLLALAIVAILGTYLIGGAVSVVGK
jgi:hypothetical protein